ncbi:aminopeptidase P family protein [Aureimonas fodinaquatilis]|uniref:Aminopeptidase P family protein n=1 Tax=Aureimonas fodinaquatilis TaxID=2565783 RepID=A0A5B0E1Q3_9HYPH|nr:aminopeptidase P family protein [Aureimonas fodinaquatilis]KAA0972596.1 aminopeptidase P family protein [Aureimonas fodinaquatilis]
MFQSFEETASSLESAERLALLRKSLAQLGVDGFIVPRADEHQGEYIPDCAARLRWLTGFSGSAGYALVLPESAVLFVDGRYTTQASQQVDANAVAIGSSVDMPLSRFLADKAVGLTIGFDPWLHTRGEISALNQAASDHGFQIVPLDHNPVDRLWPDRPLPPKGAVVLHPEQFAGRNVASKLAELAETISSASGNAAVISDPSSIAWAFNIRGSDVPHTPLALGFAILRLQARPMLFIDPEKLDEEALRYLSQLADLKLPEEFEAELKALGAGAKVLIDPALTAEKIAQLIMEGGGKVIEKPDPARLPRARKNAIELEGARTAHLRDGAAMVQFLHWLDQQEPGSVSEISAATRLEAARSVIGQQTQMPLLDVSFDSIAGSGPNAALPHYRVNFQSDRTLQEGELFLIDSGAQYRDGTTDITRTVAIGAVDEERRRKFTLVLKGMIAISDIRFPAGTRGQDLDPLARTALWKSGCDYAHGTGHGIGSYLAVHEGPQSLSKRGATPLETGMILSNEPGYYREGHFGIRIENLIVVTPPAPIEGGDMPMHGFETLTFVPIDLRLVVQDLLETWERDWLNRYHEAVRHKLSPLLNDNDRQWLAAATKPV